MKTIRITTKIILLFMHLWICNNAYSQFSATYSSCLLPDGGEIYNDEDFNFRYMAYQISNVDDNGSQSWSTIDMNGDGRSDLVVYAEKQNGVNKVLGSTSNPYWKVYLNTGTDFSVTPTIWNLPEGGELFDGIDYSFRNLNYNISGNDDNGSQAYSIMDLNGDGKPDLVVNAEKQNGSNRVFGSANNQYWKVYINTGTGFSEAAINWSLPEGGELFNGTNYSFRYMAYNIAGNDDNGSQAYSIMDLNGDAIPDLVVYAEKQNGSNRVFGSSNNRHWKVYINTGTGFSATSINWSLPSGGELYSGTNYSFRYMAYNIFVNDDNGSQAYSIMDLNGDGSPDLVVYAEKQNGSNRVFGSSNNQHWKVYLNTGDGFSATTTNWSLPNGGELYSGTNYSFRYMAYNIFVNDDNGSQAYSIMNLNGDASPDLVVYAEKQNGSNEVFGSTGNQHWEVYINTGTGFSSATTNWALPEGGEQYGGTNYSFRHIAYQISSNDDNGSQAWSITDMNGDGSPDLTVYAMKQNGVNKVFGSSDNPYWKVYLSDAVTFTKEEISEGSIDIYPNPVNNYVIIKMDTEFSNANIEVLNLQGGIIMVEKNITSKEVRLNTSHLKSGFYIIKISINNKMTQKKFIKI